MLGLGEIGAGLPVTEGKALLFKIFGGVDSVPLCVRARAPEDIVHAVELIEPSFGGVNLEDKSLPVRESGSKHADQRRCALIIPCSSAPILSNNIIQERYCRPFRVPSALRDPAPPA